jgi:hypothetical protein
MMSQMEPLGEIMLPKLLIVEGDDDRRFFHAMIKFLHLKDIEVRQVGGKDRMKSDIDTLRKTPGFNDVVVSIGLIRDADDNSQDAFKSIQGALKFAGLPVPKKMNHPIGKKPAIQVMILPDNDKSGELENLCVATLDDDSKSCLSEYIKCMKSRNRWESKKEPKSYVYAYIAAKENPRLRLGESAECGYWNFDHPAFAEIVRFLRSL